MAESVQSSEFSRVQGAEAVKHRPNAQTGRETKKRGDL
jgi:hypothetical protein